MLKIGLTGGMGSGKSTVAKIFQLLGVPVYFADEASKNLYHTNEALKAALKKEFGDDVYLGNDLNRQKLASIVFADKEKLEKLNSLVHPLTRKDASEWMARQKTPYIIKEAALLFESGSAKDLDLIVGIAAPAELRIQRVMTRDNISREQVINRINKQMDEDEKMQRCDFIIHNNEETLLIPQVTSLHQQFLEISKNKSSGH